jgi:carboxymethylenebutenolidase
VNGDSVLPAKDGHRLLAYQSQPVGDVRGGIVIIQEAFGVNNYVRSVVDRYAAHGYHAIAPALYDRQQTDVRLGYSGSDLAAARKLRGALDWDEVIADVEAAIAAVAPAGKVGIVGFCVGGSVAWLAATRLPVSAAVSYYGRDIVGFVDRRPRCPTMVHYAERDHHIPLSDVETVREAYPELPIYVFPGEHGFDCDARPSFNAESAATAGARTLALFRKFIG